MKVYLLGTIGGYRDESYATCRLDGWSDTHRPSSISWWRWGSTCPSCHFNVEELNIPWLMTWQEGSEKIGDFAGVGCPSWDIVAQDKVIKFFKKNNYFSTFFPVSFKSVPPRPKRSNKPYYPCVSTTPYTGPTFTGIKSLYGVNMNEEKSNKKRTMTCSVCGFIEYETTDSHEWENFVIDEEEWNGLRLFGIFQLGNFLELGGGLFLSEEGYDLLLKQGFSNIQCKEVGRIEKLGTDIRKPYRETADYDFWKPEEYVESSIQSKKKR